MFWIDSNWKYRHIRARVLVKQDSFEIVQTMPAKLIRSADYQIQTLSVLSFTEDHTSYCSALWDPDQSVWICTLNATVAAAFQVQVELRDAPRASLLRVEPDLGCAIALNDRASFWMTDTTAHVKVYLLSEDTRSYETVVRIVSPPALANSPPFYLTLGATQVELGVVNIIRYNLELPSAMLATLSIVPLSEEDVRVCSVSKDPDTGFARIQPMAPGDCHLVIMIAPSLFSAANFSSIVKIVKRQRPAPVFDLVNKTMANDDSLAWSFSFNTSDWQDLVVTLDDSSRYSCYISYLIFHRSIVVSSVVSPSNTTICHLVAYYKSNSVYAQSPTVTVDVTDFVPEVFAVVTKAPILAPYYYYECAL